MYEVNTREMPSRSVLCLKRNVTGWEQAWALGKEFVGVLRSPGRCPASTGAPVPHFAARCDARPRLRLRCPVG